MSTESDRPAETPDAEDSQRNDSEEDDEISATEQVHRVRQIKAIEAEGERLTNCQTAVRLKFDWDEETADQFHGALVSFISQQSAETDQLGIGEVAVALWNELARIEASLHNSSDDGDAQSEADGERPDNRHQEVTASEGNNGQAASQRDPTFH